jgi:hypothetical protein
MRRREFFTKEFIEVTRSNTGVIRATTNMEVITASSKSEVITGRSNLEVIMRK